MVSIVSIVSVFSSIARFAFNINGLRRIVTAVIFPFMRFKFPFMRFKFPFMRFKFPFMRLNEPPLAPSLRLWAGGVHHIGEALSALLRVPGALLRGSAVPVSSFREGEPLDLP